MIDYERLRVAILQQAVKDYQTALVKNDTIKAFTLECWFRSGWAQALSGGQGDLFIQKCNERVAITNRPNRLANKVERKRKK